MGQTPVVPGSGGGELDIIEEALGRILRSGALDRLHRRFDERLGVAIDRSAYLVLRRVADLGPVRPSGLARELGVEPPTVTRHLQRLESAGWVVRTGDPTDRRATLAELTAGGRAVVTRMEEARRAFLASILTRWDPSDRSALACLIDRFSADVVVRAASLPESL